MTSTVPGRDVSGSIPRHFVPGYDQPVPPGQKHSPIEAPHNYLSAYAPDPTPQHPSTPALQYPNTAALQYGNPGAELKQGADLSFGVANRLCGERPGQKPIQVII